MVSEQKTQTRPVLWNEPRELDEYVKSIPGWLSPSEQYFLNWYMEAQYQGHGAAVELGSFLGRSSAAMLDGLSRNPHEAAQNRVLHVYDNFVWEPLYNNRIPGYTLPALDDYASFEPAYLENMAPWKDRVQTHAQDIANPTWSGEPIEYLFIDVMKSWEAAAGVIKTFFPSLLEAAVVVHEDYKHYNTPWIQLTMYRLREHLRPIYSLHDACTIVFECVKPITEADCDHACDYTSFTIQEINAAFDLAREIVDQDLPFWADQIDSAHLMALIHYTSMIDETTRQKALQFDAAKRMIATLFDLDAPKLGDPVRATASAEVTTTLEQLNDPDWVAKHISWQTLQRALTSKVVNKLR